MKQPSGEPATAASAILLSYVTYFIHAGTWPMKLYAEHTKMHHFHVKKISDPTLVGKRRLARDPAAFLNHFKHCVVDNILNTWIIV